MGTQINKCNWATYYWRHPPIHLLLPPPLPSSPPPPPLLPPPASPIIIQLAACSIRCGRDDTWVWVDSHHRVLGYLRRFGTVCSHHLKGQSTQGVPHGGVCAASFPIQHRYAASQWRSVTTATIPCYTGHRYSSRTPLESEASEGRVGWGWGVNCGTDADICTLPVGLLLRCEKVTIWIYLWPVWSRSDMDCYTNGTGVLRMHTAWEGVDPQDPQFVCRPRVPPGLMTQLAPLI